MTNLENYFPLSVASGKSFCNRVQEIKKLALTIGKGQPVLLMASRRFGKTSLALTAIQKSKLPYAHMDFFSVIDESDIENIILSAAGDLITKLTTGKKKALALAHQLFDSTHIQASLDAFGLKIEIKKRRDKPAFHILEILRRIEKLAEESKTRVVLFFDEFQNISQAASTHAIESILRQVAQLTTSISFLFSGSNRHLLSNLFDDRNKPFYKLCDKINLERISEADYIKHIQKISSTLHGKELPTEVLDQLFYYSERHPYYVNLICSKIFNDPQTTLDIDDLWHQYIKEERSSIAAELDLLSKSQKKLLTVLARAGGTNKPMGQEFIHIANMSKATISQAIRFLEKKDYIYIDESNYYRILDPLLKHALANNSD